MRMRTPRALTVGRQSPFTRDRNALASVETQEAEAIEDCGRVPEHMPGRFQVGRTLELIVEVDWCFHDLLVAQLPSNDQEFQIKGEALDRQERHDLFKHLAAE